MSLNIKNSEAHELATELAARMDTSLTAAVTIALREKLAALSNGEGERRSRADRALEISRACAAILSDEALGIDHGELLYDELGLPK